MDREGQPHDGMRIVWAGRDEIMGGSVELQLEQRLIFDLLLAKPLPKDLKKEPINGFRIEAIPHGHMLVMRNRDVPGVIGRVGTILGERGVNISHFHLGRRERGGEAMAVIEIDAALDQETLDSLRSLTQVISAREIEL